MFSDFLDRHDDFRVFCSNERVCAQQIEIALNEV